MREQSDDLIDPHRSDIKITYHFRETGQLCIIQPDWKDVRLPLFECARKGSLPLKIRPRLHCIMFGHKKDTISRPFFVNLS